MIRFDSIRINSNFTDSFGTLTNHSIRRTTVQHLTQLNVMNEKIMRITGHRSTCGIAAYQTFTNQMMHETINKMIPDKCDNLDSNPNLSK